MTITWITLTILIVLFLGGLAAAAIVGLGFYLGWFRFGARSARGEDHLTLTVDENQIRAGTGRARQRLQQSERQVTDWATAPTEKEGEDLAAAPADQPRN